MPEDPVGEERGQRVTAGCDSRAGLERLEVSGEGASMGVAAPGVGIESLLDDGGEILIDAGPAQRKLLQAAADRWEDVSDFLGDA